MSKYEIDKIKVNGVKHKVNVVVIQGTKDIQGENKEKIK